jgi:hypothetical protein
MADDFNLKIIREILDKYGQSIVAEMVTRLKNLDKKATGNLINSLDYEIDDSDPNAIVLYFTAMDYAVFVDKGRKPNSKMPPEDEIKRWMKIKGIPSRLLFPIRRSIGKKGIKPTNFFTVSTTRRFGMMKKEIAKAIGDEIKNQIIAVEGLGRGTKIN